MIVCVGTSISELPSGGVLGAEMDPSVLLSWADIDIAIRGRSMYLLLVSKGNPKQKFPREWWKPVAQNPIYSTRCLTMRTQPEIWKWQMRIREMNSV